MIEPMKPKQTFHQAEIQDGDIICFQKNYNEKEYVIFGVAAVLWIPLILNIDNCHY